MPLLYGDQSARLQKLISTASPPEEFAVFFAKAMAVPLLNVVYVKQPFNSVARDTIEWLEFSNRTFDFLVAFREFKKVIPEITTFCDPIIAAGRDFRPAGPVPLTEDQAKAETIVFDTMFKQRCDFFKYLDAYKILHDVIQKLQDQIGALRKTAKDFQISSDLLRFEPVFMPMLDAIEEELLATAKRSLPNTEYPEDFDWVDSFAEALDKLRKAVPMADHVAIDGAIDILTAIQPRQSILNQEIVRSAERLMRNWDAPGQVERILTGPKTPQRVILFADLEPFRCLYLELNKLTIDHNLCQDIEESVTVVNKASAIPDRIAGWPDVFTAILRLVARRPTEDGARRLANYTHQFVAAVPPQSWLQFSLLRSQFGRLFNQIDESLITVTRELIRVAGRLSQNL